MFPKCWHSQSVQFRHQMSNTLMKGLFLSWLQVDVVHRQQRTITLGSEHEEIEGGGVVRERLSSRMTHSWYNGWLHSLTNKADKGGLGLVGCGGGQLPIWCQPQPCPCRHNSCCNQLGLNYSDGRRRTFTPGGGGGLIWHHMHSFIHSNCLFSCNPRPAPEQRRGEACRKKTNS